MPTLRESLFARNTRAGNEGSDVNAPPERTIRSEPRLGRRPEEEA